MSLVSSLRQRGARAAFVLVLVAVTVLGVAAMASAVEPDGGAGGEVILPVEPDGGIGGEVILPVEPDGGIGD
jgi:hypothetical protein